ncbi:hypothetical protein BLNAU_22213 [Blattamonas nauphoetae]|uniref:Uncharacterized protein n=1 Tax=Blattamonas nauphoetae TaxID=2049346 RepID=A0ABQ9WTQ6_9EUKA|nr:hypothetical protein BLNAU_22213 [Blattamonas nauphoetae]
MEDITCPLLFVVHRKSLSSFLEQRKIWPQLEEAIEILLLFIHHQPSLSPTNIPFLPTLSVDLANFCTTSIDASPASALPLSSITTCPITLLDEYPSLSTNQSNPKLVPSFLLPNALSPSTPVPQTLQWATSLSPSTPKQTMWTRIQAMTLLRHLILFSPPHTVKQLQDRAFRCGSMDWLHFGACSPPVAITQPRSQEKEDTSWMSMSIAAEANAVGSSAALHIRDCYRDLFFLLLSPASIEHYLVSLLPQSLYNSALVPAPLHPALTHRTRFFTPLDTKDKQSGPLQLQPSSIAHILLTSAQYRFVNRHPCAMPPSFPLLHPINLADKKLRQRERQSSVHALWVLRDLALKLRLLAKDGNSRDGGN